MLADIFVLCIFCAVCQPYFRDITSSFQANFISCVDQIDDGCEPAATSVGPPTIPIPRTQTASWHHTSSTVVDTELGKCMN